MLLGLSKINDDGDVSPLEILLGQLESDVVVLRTSGGLRMADPQKILFLLQAGEDMITCLRVYWPVCRDNMNA